MQEEFDTVCGCVEDISFRNEENGFTVLHMSTADDIVTAVGILPSVNVGESVKMTGTWQIHKTFGRQFKAESCIASMPANLGDMYRYLASGAVKGIGPATAEKIIDKFGEKTFEILESDSEALATLSGITKKKAKQICERFAAQKRDRETLEYLSEFGLTPGESVRVISAFGRRISERFEDDPYILCSEDIGISFERADEIASHLPVKPNEMIRIMAGIKHILSHNLGNGHSCVPRDLIIEPAKNLLDCDSDSAEIAVDNLISNEEIVECTLGGRDFLFLPHIYEAEITIAKIISMQVQYPPIPISALDAKIDLMESRLGIHYEEAQRRAVKIALEEGMLILTGGPGTGKTTTLNGIISLMRDSGLDIALTAPTGRAAMRMTEVTGVEASTIHRLLEVEWDKHNKAKFARCERNPLECDAVIIDEISMVDVELFAALLLALPLGCRVIMVGDFDQLPPVGAGNILQDLILWNKIKVVKLTEIFRQSLSSAIVTGAHSIVDGKVPDLSRHDSDFFFMPESTPSGAVKTVEDLACRRLVDAYDYSIMQDIQVLCASRIGETGTVNINKVIQQRVNPRRKGVKEIRYNGYILREGDKVMQVKNNYDVFWTRITDASQGMGVYNGDIGVLKSIDTASGIVNILFDDRLAEYTTDQCTDVELAYAVTVHKSQGSEFNAVIMPVISVPRPLCYRNLLYTAITRAKKLLILVGESSQIEAMVANNKKSKRFSALKYFLGAK